MKLNKQTSKVMVLNRGAGCFLKLLGLLLTILLASGVALWWLIQKEAREIRESERDALDLKRFAVQAETRILMVGNSLTHYNDLDRMVERLAEAADPAEKDVFVARIAPGGYRLAQHRDDLLDDRKDPVLRRLLVSGPKEVRDWDYVVLQEQSQILGFAPWHRETRESFSACGTIHDLVREAGAKTVWMMTWGFWNGDVYNKSIYRDFMTMSRCLEAGTLRLADELKCSETGRCLVAPVGVAFRDIFESETAKGIDPRRKTSLFRRLYVDDRHPTLAGSYLAAAVVVGTIMDAPVLHAGWVPEGLDPDLAAKLRQTADTVVESCCGENE